MVIRYLRLFCVGFISLALTFLPIFAYANAGTWTVGASSYNSGVVVNASKEVIINGAKTVVTTTAKYLPVALEVGTMALRYAGYAGVVYAVSALIGDFIPYVLNSSGVQYTPVDKKKYQFYSTCFGSNAGCSPNGTTVKFYSISQIQASFLSIKEKDAYSNPICTITNSNFDVNSAPARCIGANGYNVGWTMTANPEYVPNSAPPTAQTVDLPTLGNKIISNANSGHTASQSLLQSGVVDSLNDTTGNPPIVSIPSNVVTQFDKNAVYPSIIIATSATNASSVTTTNASGVQTTTGTSNTTFNLPDFCKYASKLCNFLDFAKDDELPTNQDTSLPTVVPDLPTLDTNRVHFGGVCPSPVLIPINLGNLGSTNLSFSYQPFCNVLSNLRPYVIGISYIIGALIIIGKR